MIYPIVQVGHPALRTAACTLSKEEILSTNIQTLIESMTQTMHAAPGVGLAAPQIGESLQIIVMEDRAEYTQNASAEFLAERERKPFPFHVLINPKIIATKSQMREFFEGCLSVEGFVSVVPRILEITVAGLNEKGMPITIEARGWYARILQHEIDHLNKTLCIDRAKKNTTMTIDNYLHYWKDLAISEVCKRLE